MREHIINSFNMINTINPEIYFQIIIISILSGIIGFEREYHGKDAWLRTHILIWVGACTATASAILYTQLNPWVKLDIFRVTSGIITGIGFLGAGTILKDSISAKGLASAANIWITAIIWILVGLGYYSIALIVTVIILINFIRIRRVKQNLKQSGKKCEINFTISWPLPPKKEIEKAIHTYGFTTVKKSYTQEKWIIKVIYIGKIDRKHNIYNMLNHINSQLETQSLTVSEL